jgi:hypothetical protein
MTQGSAFPWQMINARISAACACETLAASTAAAESAVEGHQAGNVVNRIWQIMPESAC